MKSHFSQLALTVLSILIFSIKSHSNSMNIVTYGNLSTTMSAETLLIVEEFAKDPKLGLEITSSDKGIAHRKSDVFVLTKDQKASPFLHKTWSSNKKTRESLTLFETKKSLLVVSKNAPKEFLELIRNQRDNYLTIQGESRFWNDLDEKKAIGGKLMPSGFSYYQFNRQSWKNEKEWHFSFYMTYKLKMKGKEFSATIVPKEYGGLWRLQSAFRKIDSKKNIYISTGGVAPLPDGSFGESRALKTLSQFNNNFVVASIQEVIAKKKVIDPYTKRWDDKPPIQFLAANIYENKDGKEQRLFTPYRLVNIDGVKTLLIGITSPYLAPHIEKSATKQPWLANLTIKPAKDFFKSNEYLDLRKKADIVVLATNLSKSELGESYDDLQGVDLVIARHSRLFSNPGKRSRNVNKFSSRHPRLPIFSTPSRDTFFSQTRVNIKGDRLEINEETDVLGLNWSSDGDDQSDYENFSKIFTSKDIVLPDHKEIFPGKLIVTKEEFAQLAAEVMRKTLDGEIGIFNIQTHNTNILGELDSSIIRSWVRLEEHLVVAYMFGRDITELFHQNKEEKHPLKLAFSGIDKNGLVEKSPLQPNEVYRVITSTAITNNTESYPAVARAIDKKSKFLEIDNEYKEHIGGKSVSLADFITNALRQDWNATSKLDKEQRNKFYRELYDGVFHLKNRGYWVHDFKRISLEYYTVKTTDLSSFASVVDSRLSAAEQRYMGANVSYAAIYRKKPYISELGIKGQFSKIEFNPDQATEIENVLIDDLVFFANIGLPIFKWNRLPTLTTSSGPIFEFAYDTEFEKSKGVEIERNLQSFLGWRFYDGKWLKSLTLAALNENRLTKGNEKNAWGYNARFEIAKPFHKGAVTFRSDFDYRYFFNSEKDSAQDLESRLIWDNFVDIKIFGKLSFGPYFKWAVFKGQTFDDEVTQSTVGVNFNFSSLWKPKYQSSPF